jgi:cephalosporin-C deacetylase
MSKIFHNIPRGCALIFAFLLLSNSIIFSQVKIVLPNNKHIAKVGENVQIRITSNGWGEGTYDISYDPRLPTSVIQRGTFTASQGNDAVINFSLPHAGMVFIRANQAGSDQAVLAVDPLSIKPIQAEPNDFDAFWSAQKAALAAVPINPQLFQINSLPNGTRVFKIQFGNVDGRSVFGYLAVPSGAGPFPAVLTVPPFGDSPIQAEPLGLTDYAEKSKAIAMSISIHNAPIDQVDPQAYRPDDLTRREGHYARYMVLSCLRAVDYLFSRSDFNGDLGVSGNSQGGFLSLAVAGLDSRVKAVMPINNSSSEQNGWRFNRSSGFPNFVQSGRNLNLDSNAVIRAMQYYDAAYFAKRIKGVMMFQTGYEDDLTPAATQFAAANEHRGTSTILHMREYGHNYPFPEYFLGRYTFFKQHLKGFETGGNFQKSFTISAGNDQNTPNNTVNLTARALVDGATSGISNIRWEKIEGVGNVNFSNPNAFSTTATFSQSGRYVLKIMADHDYTINDPNNAMYYTLVDYVTINAGSNGGNACDNDTTPPVLTNCPTPISITTANDSEVVTWQNPVATDNCSTPSVTSNFQSGARFPVGTTTVVYTATDAKNNRVTCNFTVTVRKDSNSTADSTVYLVRHTNNTCPQCPDKQWVPYGLFINDANGCPGEFWKPDVNVVFTVKSNNTATLRGTFRDNEWNAMEVNVTFSGRRSSGEPTLEFCQINRPRSVANNWFYYENLSGTLQKARNTPLSIQQTNMPLQVGMGANNQDLNTLGASGGFRMTDGRVGKFGFQLNPSTNNIVGRSVVNGAILPQTSSKIPVSIQTLYPNPTDGLLEVRLNSQAEEAALLIVRDAVGKNVLTNQINLKKGENRTVLDVSVLSNGVYFLTSKTSLGHGQQMKFVKF